MRTVLITALVLLIVVTAEGTCLDGDNKKREYGCQICNDNGASPFWSYDVNVWRKGEEGPTMFACMSAEHGPKYNSGDWGYVKCTQCKQIGECEAECTPESLEYFIRAASEAGTPRDVMIYMRALRWP